MKKLLAGLMAFLMLFSIVACGDTTGGNTDAVENEESVTMGENSENSSTPKPEETLDKWKEKDATYIGSDEFGEDLENLSDELYEGATDLGGYTDEEERIWKYCQDRWDYYDKLEGGYSGDKYTVNVFQDAGDKFGISASEAKSIWSKVDRAKLGLN